MSIWVSHDSIGTDEYEPSNGDVRSYANGWSNHYPDHRVEQPAAIYLSHIPVYCVPGHRDEEGYGPVGEWLRLSVHSWRHDWHHPEKVLEPADLSVVLDEDAARSLVAELSEWLELPKAQPKEEA